MQTDQRESKDDKGHPSPPRTYEFGLWKVVRSLGLTVLITGAVLAFVRFVLGFEVF